MPTVTFEDILAQVSELPAEERGKLLSRLKREERRKPLAFHSKVICTNAPYVDRKLEYEWLKQHEREYIGQWIALKDDQLLAHGGNAKDVSVKARELGVRDALVLLVEDPDVAYMGV